MLIHNDTYATTCARWHANDQALSEPDWDATLRQAQQVGGNPALCPDCIGAGVGDALDEMVADGTLILHPDGRYEIAPEG